MALRSERRPGGWLGRFLLVVAAVLVMPAAKIEVRGRRDVADFAPIVAGANHRSLFDALVGMAVFRRIHVYPRVMVAKQFAPGPVGWLLRRVGAILVDRSEGAPSVVEQASAAVRDGATLMIMPEGELHWNPLDPRELGTIHPGVARIARAAGVPMLPVSVDGTEQVWPAGSFPRMIRLRRPTVVVTIGDPIVVGDGDDQVEADRLMSIVRDGLAAKTG